MQRPEVRVIQDQEVKGEIIQVSPQEANELLMKYGYKETEYNRVIQAPEPKNEMTAEELFALQDAEIKRKMEYERQLRYGPKPITFDPRNVHYSNSDYSTMEIDGNNINLKIQIVSDMPINKGRY